MCVDARAGVGGGAAFFPFAFLFYDVKAARAHFLRDLMVSGLLGVGAYATFGG